MCVSSSGYFPSTQTDSAWGISGPNMISLCLLTLGEVLIPAVPGEVCSAILFQGRYEQSVASGRCINLQGQSCAGPAQQDRQKACKFAAGFSFPGLLSDKKCGFHSASCEGCAGVQNVLTHFMSSRIRGMEGFSARMLALSFEAEFSSVRGEKIILVCQEPVSSQHQRRLQARRTEPGPPRARGSIYPMRKAGRTSPSVAKS